MTRAVIAGFARTPFHFANKGRLAGVRPDDLAAIAIKGLVERTGVDPQTLEDVVLGVAYPEAEQGSNIARLAGLLAGLPIERRADPTSAVASPRCRCAHVEDH